MPEVMPPQGATEAIEVLLGVDGYVLFAALLGALLVYVLRDRLACRKARRPRLGRSLLLIFVAVGVGHLFEPLIVALAPLLSRGMAAFVAAVVVIPISLKVMDWLDTLDLHELIRRLRRKD